MTNTLAMKRLAFAAVLVIAVLAPRAASAVKSAELLTNQAYFYGRFEARVRFAPGEGVVSSFFLWRDGSSSSTSWNELDYEKINSTCHLQTNIWTGKGTQSAMLNTPTFNICNEYHTYAFEWTPDYIAWLIDGTQIRKVTGASVTEYTQNASQGMSMHFNTWAGNSTFGGVLDTSILPVHEYISWAQYSSYANNTFTLQWRQEFDGSAMPSGWSEGTWASPYNLSTHDPANVNYVNGIAILSMTADTATGFTGTPPADPAAGGTGGTSGGGGASGTGGTGGSGAGRGGAGGTAGTTGRGGAAGSASPGSGGTSSTGTGGNGAGGNTVSGAGGVSAGSAGNGAGGVSAGSAGNGAGGTSAGTAGSGAGGVSAGTAGSGTGGPSGSGGVTGSAGTGQTTSGTGGAGTGTGAGQAGSTGQTGGNSGCSCDVGAGDGSRAAVALLLLIPIVAARRRSRRAMKR